MKLGRPRTLLGLILMGLALVTLPLLVSVGNAVLKLGQLASDSEAVVSQSASATLENQRLAGLLTDMERNARQYLVLRARREGNTALYESDYATFKEIVAALQALPRTDAIDEQIDELERTAERVQTIVRSPPAEADPAGTGSAEAPVDPDQMLVAEFRAMIANANSVSRAMRLLMNERLNALQENTRNAQRALAWQSAALIPSTVVLVIFFLLLVGRPMRQVDRAIRELGKADFSHPIHITGPADIETLGRQLEWLRHSLKESSDEKNKFLRHMSHELKTPLANIREGTELLLDGSVGELDQQQQEVTSILRDNGIKLQKLIENLLTFSAWQAKTASLDLTDFELKPMVFSILSQHRLAISNRKLKLSIQVSPISIRADEGKLRLVLENLVSNAMKFTPDRGTIHIAAEMRGPELVIDVADSGPGIAPEDGDRIFEAFYQGRRLQGGPVGGTGIGLSVVHECVQAHGGSVKLVDGEWSGAHFRVELPLRRITDRPALVVNG
jgi:two-component system sensor histidine kinase GlrK